MFEAVFGVAFLLVPVAVFRPLGVAPDALAIGITRLFGTAVLTFAVLLWLARRARGGEIKRTASIALFTYYVLSTGVVIQIQLSGLLNALGWGVLGSHAVLAFAFGYFVVKK
jgi:Ca2+/Na+ antiporter